MGKKPFAFDASSPAFHFGRAMVRARNARKMSQEELATRTGMPRQAISRYESGRARLTYDRAVVIGFELGISLDRLE